MKKEFRSPVYNVIAVPMEKIEANDYNPNHVAKREMDLLYQSIKADGYTMPVVAFYDQERDKYIIVDGFHRYTIMLTRKDIFYLRLIHNIIVYFTISFINQTLFFQ